MIILAEQTASSEPSGQALVLLWRWTLGDAETNLVAGCCILVALVAVKLPCIWFSRRSFTGGRISLQPGCATNAAVTGTVDDQPIVVQKLTTLERRILLILLIGLILRESLGALGIAWHPPGGGSVDRHDRTTQTNSAAVKITLFGQSPQARLFSFLEFQDPERGILEVRAQRGYRRMMELVDELPTRFLSVRRKCNGQFRDKENGTHLHTRTLVGLKQMEVCSHVSALLNIAVSVRHVLAKADATLVGRLMQQLGTCGMSPNISDGGEKLLYSKHQLGVLWCHWTRVLGRLESLQARGHLMLQAIRMRLFELGRQLERSLVEYAHQFTYSRLDLLWDNASSMAVDATDGIRLLQHCRSYQRVHSQAPLSKPEHVGKYLLPISTKPKNCTAFPYAHAYMRTCNEVCGGCDWKYLSERNASFFEYCCNRCRKPYKLTLCAVTFAFVVYVRCSTEGNDVNVLEQDSMCGDCCSVDRSGCGQLSSVGVSAPAAGDSINADDGGCQKRRAGWWRGERCSCSVHNSTHCGKSVVLQLAGDMATRWKGISWKTYTAELMEGVVSVAKLSTTDNNGAGYVVSCGGDCELPPRHLESSTVFPTGTAQLGKVNCKLTNGNDCEESLRNTSKRFSVLPTSTSTWFRCVTHIDMGHDHEKYVEGNATAHVAMPIAGWDIGAALPIGSLQLASDQSDLYWMQTGITLPSAAPSTTSLTMSSTPVPQGLCWTFVFLVLLYLPWIFVGWRKLWCLCINQHVEQESSARYSVYDSVSYSQLAAISLKENTCTQRPQRVVHNSSSESCPDIGKLDGGERVVGYTQTMRDWYWWWPGIEATDHGVVHPRHLASPVSSFLSCTLEVLELQGEVLRDAAVSFRSWWSFNKALPRREHVENLFTLEDSILPPILGEISCGVAGKDENRETHYACFPVEWLSSLEARRRQLRRLVYGEGKKKKKKKRRRKKRKSMPGRKQRRHATRGDNGQRHESKGNKEAESSASAAEIQVSR